MAVRIVGSDAGSAQRIVLAVERALSEIWLVTTMFDYSGQRK